MTKLYDTVSVLTKSLKSSRAARQPACDKRTNRVESTGSQLREALRPFRIY